MDIALVSYINTRPFLDGLQAHFTEEEARLHLMPPADCARYLAQGRCDIALIPAGALPAFRGQDIHLLPDYCIGANGQVESVFIFSQRPIEQLDTLRLDPHSRSSNGLARILLQHHWRRDLALIQPTERDFAHIAGATGAVVIGDEAVRLWLSGRYAYAYDLAEAWHDFTGLPFAFAVWAYRPGQLRPSQIQALGAALEAGIQQPLDSAARWAGFYDLPPDFSRRYLSECIDYRFDAPKHRALARYIRLLTALPELPTSVQTQKRTV
ncbi:MAG: hypothetical protein D6722_08835 [Bacteroidetes bacterium]|nr:MAG: hypothetical protein D6722_08835 [Bacteroidota bacterium]